MTIVNETYIEYSIGGVSVWFYCLCNKPKAIGDHTSVPKNIQRHFQKYKISQVTGLKRCIKEDNILDRAEILRLAEKTLSLRSIHGISAYKCEIF